MIVYKLHAGEIVTMNMHTYYCSFSAMVAFPRIRAQQPRAIERERKGQRERAGKEGGSGREIERERERLREIEIERD